MNRPRNRSIYLREWMDILHVTQEQFEIRSEELGHKVDQSTISGLWNDPNRKPRPDTVRACYATLKDFDAEGLLRSINDLYTHPSERVRESGAKPGPSDAELLANKDKIMEGLEMLAAKGDISELDILRKLVEWREKGIIK